MDKSARVLELCYECWFSQMERDKRRIAKETCIKFCIDMSSKTHRKPLFIYREEEVKRSARNCQIFQ